MKPAGTGTEPPKTGMEPAKTGTEPGRCFGKLLVIRIGPGRTGYLRLFFVGPSKDIEQKVAKDTKKTRSEMLKWRGFLRVGVENIEMAEGF